MIQTTADTVDRILSEASVPYEIVFVNDGSKDGTWQQIETAAEKNPHVNGLHFSRNFGKESAIFAGLANAEGDCCAVMDCDLQHPPETLIKMYRLWEDGYQVIEGVKASRGREIPRLGTGAFVTCRSGYYVWKNWDNWETNFNNGNLNTADKPIFKIEEVLLNEAEAKFELGNFDQGVADKTINKLRERAGVAKMVVAEIDANFDPNRGKYYPKNNDAGVEVDPVLWEIRRERIIELMGEGFGFYDIRRWRMAPWFLNRPATGIWMSKADALSNNMTLYNPETGYSDGTSGTMSEGYLYLFNDPLKEGKGWLEKYYLYQVPTTEILLNPSLEQNPGW